jgi:Ig-like domain-containing protein
MKKRAGFVATCILSLAFFGCGRTAETEAPSPAAQDTSAAAPTPSKAPHESYSLQWVSNDTPATMGPGARVPVHVTVKNTGNWPWPDALAANPSKPDGTFAVALFYRWSGSPEQKIPDNATRGKLSKSIAPEETASFTITVDAPKEPGSYKLQFDLVEELVTFFSTKGSERLTVPVTVQ